MTPERVQMKTKKETPLLLCQYMVRAFVEGRKTQTRRVIRPQPDYVSLDGIPYPCGGRFVGPRIKCPYGQPRDLLWFKQTLFVRKSDCELWAELTDVRVERLQEISREDCFAEGIQPNQNLSNDTPALTATWPIECYRHLWDSLNGRKPGSSWKDNPWIWSLSFRRIEKP